MEITSVPCQCHACPRGLTHVSPPGVTRVPVTCPVGSRVPVTCPHHVSPGCRAPPVGFPRRCTWRARLPPPLAPPSGPAQLRAPLPGSGPAPGPGGSGSGGGAGSGSGSGGHGGGGGSLSRPRPRRRRRPHEEEAEALRAAACEAAAGRGPAAGGAGLGGDAPDQRAEPGAAARDAAARRLQSQLQNQGQQPPVQQGEPAQPLQVQGILSPGVPQPARALRRRRPGLPGVPDAEPPALGGQRPPPAAVGRPHAGAEGAVERGRGRRARAAVPLPPVRGAVPRADAAAAVPGHVPRERGQRGHVPAGHEEPLQPPPARAQEVRPEGLPGGSGSQRQGEGQGAAHAQGRGFPQQEREGVRGGGAAARVHGQAEAGRGVPGAAEADGLQPAPGHPRGGTGRAGRRGGAGGRGARSWGRRGGAGGPLRHLPGGVGGSPQLLPPPGTRRVRPRRGRVRAARRRGSPPARGLFHGAHRRAHAVRRPQEGGARGQDRQTRGRSRDLHGAPRAIRQALPRLHHQHLRLRGGAAPPRGTKPPRGAPPPPHAPTAAPTPGVSLLKCLNFM